MLAVIRVGQPITLNYFIGKTGLIAVTPRTGFGLGSAGWHCRGVRALLAPV